MKLYDFMKMSETDYDTYDTVYDACVTVCYADEEVDSYDKFCNEIMKKVEVAEVHENCLIVDWSALISGNIDKFREFTEKHWRYTYEDDEDELIYQWINEIHAYMAGYVSENFYNTLVKFVETLEA